MLFYHHNVLLLQPSANSLQTPVFISGLTRKLINTSVLSYITIRRVLNISPLTLQHPCLQSLIVSCYSIIFLHKSTDLAAITTVPVLYRKVPLLMPPVLISATNLSYLEEVVALLVECLPINQKINWPVGPAGMPNPLAQTHTNRTWPLGPVRNLESRSH